MKKVMILLIIITMALMIVACGTLDNRQTTGSSNENTRNEIQVAKQDASKNESEETKTDEEESETDKEEVMKKSNSNKMQIQIGEVTLTATLEDNVATNALKGLISETPLTIHFSQYGGNEQVGSIGTTLPRDDKQITTSAGDIVLYTGNQMVMFYGSNSWAYTRLGTIDDLSDSELSNLLGNGDVTATFTLAE
jgi:hypothetical protein